MNGFRGRVVEQFLAIVALGLLVGAQWVVVVVEAVVVVVVVASE